MDRREYIVAAGAGLAGAVAGCSGQSETGSDSEGTTDNPTGSGTSAAESTAAAEPTDSGYSVSMEPVGEVSFESVPEGWVANNGSWADMGIALGLDAPEGVWLPSRYHTQYYDEIPGVSVDGSSLRKLWGDSGVGKEQFYEIDADIHVMDPNFLQSRGSWERSDIEEIESQIAPFFGNSIFSTGYTWHDYTYYTLYEAFEKLSRAFQRTDRFEAFQSLHEEFRTGLGDIVPDSNSDRPEVAIMWAGGNEPTSFSPYLIEDGTSFKQWRDLRVRDAFAKTDVRDFHADRSTVDFETLLDIDPEYMLLRGHETKTRAEFEDTVVSYLESDETGSELTAVQNGNVFRGGPLYQGPITNLVVTERAASQVYDVDRELFDRQRVADIVAGDL
ncbi:Fe3+-hydroxamate ABC transporter substrate-binding protein [Haloarcula taiwanensis]|uniref:Fe3+-hydroxamate ABC transporter substrate-binding protein n=1 Tax=Haloarcula taiwanensis TaxID=1932004 RepID=A0A2H4ZY14_9EURY|nr:MULTISPECIES: ABC transporter substrate-binding protein [Haloarcula]AUG47364.1 Fe3+-hydroxamate ABC transporter substrate-binding protein [Haloarcula taiwanensis]RLM33966.1 Fe3+-hydroxamate ABC transporter substrate-binding protein [Haloarcula sp. Atlit-120R]RLM42461.1 Fe3+-hydroxamate ABC transporter substrate-binding protein [Haloarcula sp. Atlit-47R]